MIPKIKEHANFTNCMFRPKLRIIFDKRFDGSLTIEAKVIKISALRLEWSINGTFPINSITVKESTSTVANTMSLLFDWLVEITWKIFDNSHQLSDPIGTASSNLVESDLGCTLRIYFDKVTLMLHNMMLTSQKLCQHNKKCDFNKI